MKVLKVELSDGRIVDVREPFPSEFRDARHALAEVAKMEDLTKENGLVAGEAVSGDMVASLLTDPRMDGLTSPDVLRLVGLLSGLKDEANQVGMSDYFALLVATAEVTSSPFAPKPTKPSSSTTPSGATRSRSGRTTSSSASSSGKSSASPEKS